jgi:hypothetical protein
MRHEVRGYLRTRGAPHHNSSGKRLASKKLTAIRRLCDQLSTGPSGVVAQSSERMRDPFRSGGPGANARFPPRNGWCRRGSRPQLQGFRMPARHRQLIARLPINPSAATAVNRAVPLPERQSIWKPPRRTLPEPGTHFIDGSSSSPIRREPEGAYLPGLFSGRAVQWADHCICLGRSRVRRCCPLLLEIVARPCVIAAAASRR